ncbi:MAG: orotidine-5'-phosphate decarboxylase, partial [Flavobacteriales bacterium]|nr:orotidine-5'-phosphate decarboxylase [Flavobacteriales bacterium]
MSRSELTARIKQRQTFLIVGLDTDVRNIPAILQSSANGVAVFNQAIIEATSDYCIGYKINLAFYEAMGVKGWEAVEQTLQAIPPGHLVIADAKRGDIGNTSHQYARAFFETFRFDAITVNPYMGEDSVLPFLS